MAAYYQCPGCGAIMQDDPESSVVMCKNCGATVTKTEYPTDIARLKEIDARRQITNRKIDLEEANQRHEKRISKVVMTFFIILTVFFFVGGLVVLPMLTSSSDTAQRKQLDSLIAEIEIDIQNEEYDSALIKTNRLRWSGSTTVDIKYYDDLRIGYERLISELRRR